MKVSKCKDLPLSIKRLTELSLTWDSRTQSRCNCKQFIQYNFHIKAYQNQSERKSHHNPHHHANHPHWNWLQWLRRKWRFTGQQWVKFCGLKTSNKLMLIFNFLQHQTISFSTPVFVSNTSLWIQHCLFFWAALYSISFL